MATSTRGGIRTIPPGNDRLVIEAKADVTIDAHGTVLEADVATGPEVD